MAVGEIAGSLLENPEVIRACDVVGMHQYPYWEGECISHAIRNLDLAYSAVKAIAGNREVRILETGWPTAGRKRKWDSRYDQAVASLWNARRYLEGVRRWARLNRVIVYWFELADERWKLATEGPPGPHWGRFTEDLIRKY